MKSSEVTVAVFGGGGREAALIEWYVKSPQVDRLLAFPGSDWIKHRVTHKPVETFPRVNLQKLTSSDIAEIMETCKGSRVALLDVAQEDAVAANIAGITRGEGLLAVGPTAAAGEIESNKAFCRDLLKGLVPQPEYAVCHSEIEGANYILKMKPFKSVFVKASGLALGKGAIGARTVDVAFEAVGQMKQFGKAGETFLIEEWLRSDDGTPGEEISVFAMGRNVVDAAQDKKPVFDGDQGPNTGGMGCSSSPLAFTEDIRAQAQEMINITHDRLEEVGRPYNGVLYLGGMIVKRGDRKVLYLVEFNSRWGDPEAQVIVPYIENDALETGVAVAEGRQNSLQIKTREVKRVTVALASRGYPDSASEEYKASQNRQIFGIEEARQLPGVRYYGAGMRVEEMMNADEKWYLYMTKGGRIGYIGGEGPTMIDARRRAYDARALIHGMGNSLHSRADVGWEDVEREYLSLPYSLPYNDIL